MAEEKILEQLEHSLAKLQAQEACRNLMGRFSYYHAVYRSKECLALWADREDSSLELIWGSYSGIGQIKKYFLEDLGDRSDSKVQEKIKGTANVYEADTEIIEVAEDLKTAKAAFISQGNETYVDRSADEEIVHAQWVWNKYAVDFIQEDGEWKIWHIHCYPMFRSEFGEGWAEAAQIDPKDYSDTHAELKEQIWHYDKNEVYPADQPEPPKPYTSFGETQKH